MRPGWPDFLAETDDSRTRKAAEAILSVVFPPHCLLCGGFVPEFDLHSVCLACWQSLPRLRAPWCARCGMPIESAAAYERITSPICSRCIQAPPPFTAARACGAYEGLLRELIHHFKFGGRRDLALPFGRWMGQTCAALPELEDYEIIVPVPLHPRRQKERGFNQAGLLARQLSIRTGRAMESALLVRSRNTHPQSGLTDSQRQENTRGCFRAGQSEKVHGRRILLIDDVCTTGSTLEAGCRALLEAGAAGVAAFTLARVTRSG